MSTRTQILWMLTTALVGCAKVGASMSPAEATLNARFQPDRENYREVSERTVDYVDPRDGRAVSGRSIKVESDIQRCMLSRGWNEPRQGGWRYRKS